MRGKSFGAAASPVQRVGAPSASAGVRRLIANFTSAQSTTTSLSAPVAGIYRLVLVGAGGTGGAQASGNTLATGGGSGGVVVSKPFRMAANQAQSVTFRALGAQAVANAGTEVEGNAGGTTNAILPDGTVLTAGGGGGGRTGFAGNSPLAGGAGGVATGGEFNYPGNPGGIATDSGTISDAAQGGVDTYVIGSASFRAILSANTATTNGKLAASGGGNPPTADGLLPIIPGSRGAATGTGGAGSAGSPGGPFLYGYGSGGAATGSSSAISGPAGSGAAFLILEVPL